MKYITNKSYRLFINHIIISVENKVKCQLLTDHNYINYQHDNLIFFGEEYIFKL